MPRLAMCPRCNGEFEPATSLNGGQSEFWLKCTSCNTYYNSYNPLPHQEAVHKSTSLYKGNFGAYGTGKTLTSRQEVYKHALLTPNGNTLIGAKTTQQYEQTIKREIENDLPAALVKEVSKLKSYITLNNGHRIIFRPFDDPDKLRSYNLTMFVIVEGSEVVAEVYHQLKTRLRNSAAINPTTGSDWRCGIIESNPDSGWIRTDVLLTSHNITQFGHTLETHNPPEHMKDPATESFVASTSVNPFLPPTFIEELSKNKPKWWVSRYLHGSFSYAEGLVYPTAMKSTTPHFQIPKDWPRLIAADYGLSDPFAWVQAAIDPDTFVIHIYREDENHNQDIAALAQQYNDITADIPAGAFLSPPLLDPKSGAKRDYNKKSLYDHFLDHGIYFKPGHPSVDARIFRVNSYLLQGRLVIHDSCTKLLGELSNYKFPDKTLNYSRHNPDKPQDKNNHFINAMEWICMELPANLTKLRYSNVHLKNHFSNQGLTPWDDKPKQDVKQVNHMFNMGGGGFF